MSRNIRIIWPRKNVHNTGDFLRSLRAQGAETEEDKAQYLEGFSEFSGGSLELLRLMDEENYQWSSETGLSPVNDDKAFMTALWQRVQEEQVYHPGVALVPQMEAIVESLFHEETLTASAMAEKFPDDNYVSSDVRHVLLHQNTPRENEPDRILYTARHFFLMVNSNINPELRRMNDDLMYIFEMGDDVVDHFKPGEDSFMHQLIDCNRLEFLMTSLAGSFKAAGRFNIGVIAEAFGEHMRPLAKDIVKRAEAAYAVTGGKPRVAPIRAEINSWVFKL